MINLFVYIGGDYTRQLKAVVKDLERIDCDRCLVATIDGASILGIW
ncbi:hypothetical protein [Fischerella sp. PCC 9605]|nr:hypothetical protein [Fischerella sp. PCC 9605]